MSDLRPTGIPIELGDEERYLLFTLNVMDELQSQFDKTMEEIMNGLLDKKTSVDYLKKIVTVLLNDEIRRKKYNGEEAGKEVTEKEVGWMIHGGNVMEVTLCVYAAYGYSLPEADEFDDPNRETGQ